MITIIKKQKQVYGERGTLYSAVGNATWCRHYRKQLRFLKKLKIELPYKSAIPLLGIYPDKTVIQKDTGTPMLTATLLTIAKT